MNADGCFSIPAVITRGNGAICEIAGIAPRCGGFASGPIENAILKFKNREKQTIFLHALTCAALVAQPKSDARIGAILNDLSSTHSFQEVAISPDGKRIAWVEELIENGKDTGSAAIFSKEIGSAAAAARISMGRHIAWSPDSARIAFLSDQEKKQQNELYVAAAAGGRAKRLTNLTGYITDPEWSPDGTRIAILFAENAPSGGGPLEAEPIETGVIGGEIHNQRMTIVDASSGADKTNFAGGLEYL